MRVYIVVDSSSFRPPEANLNATSDSANCQEMFVYTLSRLSIAFNTSLTQLLLSRFFSSIAVPNQNKVGPRRQKKARITQYGHRKWGTHARVFSQTLVHGNSKNEIDKETDEEGKKRAISMERS